MADLLVTAASPARPSIQSLRSLALVVALVALQGGVACAGGRAGAGWTGDRAAAAAQEARDADRAMATAVAVRDIGAFSGLVAVEALFFSARGPLPGRAAVALGWAPFFAPDGPRLAWTPDRAEASPSGDLVFTFGPYTFTAAGGAQETGRYLTAWRREADGKLRAAIDADAEPGPPVPPEVVRRPLRTLTSADGVLAAEAGLLLDGAREAGHYVRFSRREGTRFAPLADVADFKPEPR
jgi:ketosteroid isomerase-like protein